MSLNSPLQKELIEVLEELDKRFGPHYRDRGEPWNQELTKRVDAALISDTDIAAAMGASLENPSVHGASENQPVHPGVSLIAAERQRQVTQEGWSADHDSRHEHGELAEAGAAYALTGKLTDETLIETVREIQVNSDRGLDDHYDYRMVRNKFPVFPWAEEWWKPSDDPIRNLVKAGALIAAEIDRLLRLNPDYASSDPSGLKSANATSVSSPKTAESFWIKDA